MLRYWRSYSVDAVRQGGRHGQTAVARWSLGTDLTTVATRAGEAEGRAATRPRSPMLDRHLVRVENRLSLGISAARVGLWQWDDLLATVAGLASRRSMEGHLGNAARRTRFSRCDRLVDVGDRQLFAPGSFWGQKTGPNPTDRGKSGSKRHLLTDGAGTPLAIKHSAANLHDSQMAIELVDAVPPIKQPRGAPRRRPDEVLADRGYDADEKIRQPLRKRRIKPLIARRNTEHGSGLGRYRYVVEACFAWLFNWRRLRIRYEKRDDIHEAFLTLGCIMICWQRIITFC